MAEQGKKKYNYQYESTARAYIEPVEPLKVPPSEPKRKSKALPKHKVNVAFSIQVTLCGVVLFTCAMLYINTYATLRTRQSELNTLKNEKIAVANAITKVEADITKKLDLEYIRQRATDELGMRKPLAYQIVYIQLPEKSYTTYN